MKDKSKVNYVKALKRILRAAGQVFIGEPSVTELEARLRDVTKLAPGVTARGLARIYEDAARAWERGSNSGSNEVMAAMNAKCEELRNTADAILLLWGVKVDYPGLYPSFEWQGGHYYDCESLMKFVSGQCK